MKVVDFNNAIKVWGDGYLRRTTLGRLEYVSSVGVHPIKVANYKVIGFVGAIPTYQFDYIQSLVHRDKWRDSMYKDYAYIRKQGETCKVSQLPGTDVVLMYDGKKNKLFLSDSSGTCYIKVGAYCGALNLLPENDAYINDMSAVYAIISEIPNFIKLLYGSPKPKPEGIIKEWYGAGNVVKASLFMRKGALYIRYGGLKKTARVFYIDDKVMQYTRHDVPKVYDKYIRQWVKEQYMWG